MQKQFWVWLLMGQCPLWKPPKSTCFFSSIILYKNSYLVNIISLSLSNFPLTFMMTGLNVVIIFWLFHGKACDECVEFRHWDSEHDTGTKQLYTAKGHSQGIERNNRGRGRRREAGGKWRRGSKGQGLDLNRDYFGIYHSKEMEQKKQHHQQQTQKSIVDVKIRHQFIFTCSIFHLKGV